MEKLEKAFYDLRPRRQFRTSSFLHVAFVTTVDCFAAELIGGARLNPGREHIPRFVLVPGPTRGYDVSKSPP